MSMQFLNQSQSTTIYNVQGTVRGLVLPIRQSFEPKGYQKQLDILELLRKYNVATPVGVSSEEVLGISGAKSGDVLALGFNGGSTGNQYIRFRRGGDLRVDGGFLMDRPTIAQTGICLFSAFAAGIGAEGSSYPLVNPFQPVASSIGSGKVYARGKLSWYEVESALSLVRALAVLSPNVTQVNLDVPSTNYKLLYADGVQRGLLPASEFPSWSQLVDEQATRVTKLFSRLCPFTVRRTNALSDIEPLIDSWCRGEEIKLAAALDQLASSSDVWNQILVGVRPRDLVELSYLGYSAQYLMNIRSSGKMLAVENFVEERILVQTEKLAANLGKFNYLLAAAYVYPKVYQPESSLKGRGDAWSYFRDRPLTAKDVAYLKSVYGC